MSHPETLVQGDFAAIILFSMDLVATTRYSTVTDLARLRGLSTSVPREVAVW